MLSNDEIYQANVEHVTDVRARNTVESFPAVLEFWNEETHSLWRLTGDRDNLIDFLLEIELIPSCPLDIYGLGGQFVNLLRLPYVGLRVETETNLELDLWYINPTTFEVKHLENLVLNLIQISVF